MGTWWLENLRARYDVLIVANGTAPLKAVYRALRPRCGTVLALDGGVGALRAIGDAPEHVIGDLDSMTRSDFDWASRRNTRIHPAPSQEYADIDKGLAYCRLKQWKRVLILGADGDRLDHVLNTLVVSGGAKGLDVTLVTRRSLVFILRGRATKALAVPDRHTVSWFGLPEAQSCTLSGVKWPFMNRRLRLGGKQSLSNLPAGEEVRVSQRSGVSLLIISLRPRPLETLLFSR